MSINILCYWDSNTWWWVPGSMWTKRFWEEIRRPARMQRILWNSYRIIEQWLWWRTTSFDDPRENFPERNWYTTLTWLLESYLPLDIVIVMLGTTDTKEMLDLDWKEIAGWMEKIVTLIKEYKTLDWDKSPKIIVISPPHIIESWDLGWKLFAWSREKSVALELFYEDICKRHWAMYVKWSDIASYDAQEWVHLDEEWHEKFALFLSNKIRDVQS